MMVMTGSVTPLLGNQLVHPLPAASRRPPNLATD
jgi:hypothetical protein